MNPDNIVNILYNGEIMFKLNANSPNLDNFVTQVISKIDLEPESITCQTDIENFDISSFEMLIRKSVKDLREKLENDLKDFAQISESIVKDKDVSQYFQELINK